MSWKEKVFLKKNSVSAFISSLQKMDTDTGLSVFIIFKGYTTSTFIKLNQINVYCWDAHSDVQNLVSVETSSVPVSVNVDTAKEHLRCPR